MNLEDHLGDVIRKARSSVDLSIEDAAKVAGLSAAELSALEDSGQFSKRPNFSALAGRIGLDGTKLEKIAGGWQPVEPELTQWRELRRFTTSAEGITVNCYLIWDEGSHDAALFDTGWDAEPILKTIADNRLQLRHLFITHSHADHIDALELMRQQFPQARLHSNSQGAPPQHRNRVNDFIQVGSLLVTNRETPGHAEDGVTYIVGNWPEDAPHEAIVVDAIFAASMGRGNQSWDLAKGKVKENIFSLPPETLLCPGHGPFTTVGQEKANNPFF